MGGAGPLRGVVFHTSWGGASPETAMRPLVVVVADEAVSWSWSAASVGGWVVGCEPFLLGLVEAFDFAAGLGVIRPRVSDAGHRSRRGWSAKVGTERAAVVGEEPFGPAVTSGTSAIVSQAASSVQRATAEDRVAVREQSSRTVDDLDFGFVGECPVGGVDLPALVRSFGGEAAPTPPRRLGRSGRDEPPPGQHPPDGRRRRQPLSMVKPTGQPVLNRGRSRIQAHVGELLTEPDDQLLDLARCAVRDPDSGLETSTPTRPRPAPRTVLATHRTSHG